MLDIDGTLNAATHDIDLEGDLEKSGTLSHTGTFTLDGTGDQNIFGATNFENLTIDEGGVRIIGFEENITQTVSGTLKIDLSAGNEVSIRTIDNT